MFRRRRPAQGAEADPAEDRAAGQDGSPVEGTDEAGSEHLGESPPAPPPPAPKSERPDGPWDISELDEPRSGRLDLGALLVPAVQGAQVRVDVDKASGRVVAAAIVLGESALQLQAFAAPRSEGVWPEIRAEILAGITEQHGTGEEVEGPFGTELRARVPVALPEGKAGFQPLRFLGVDGPRWFLRGVMSGRAALDPAAAGDLETLFRRVVVIRGSEARPPREALALTLPSGATSTGPGGGTATGAEPAAGASLEADAESAAGARRPGQTPARPDLNPFARGPEITELR